MTFVGFQKHNSHKVPFYQQRLWSGSTGWSQWGAPNICCQSATVTEMPFTCFALEASQDFCNYVVKTRPPPPLLALSTHTHPSPHLPMLHAYRAAQSLDSWAPTMLTLCFFSALWSRPSLVQASHHFQHQQFHWVEWADTAADFCLPSGRWPTSMQAPKTDAYLIIYGTSRCLLMTEPMNNLKWRFSLN